jgi:hypothetical protein
MAQRRRRKYGYKFTEKTQSKKGIAAFFLAVLSIAIFIYVVVNSFHHGGNGRGVFHARCACRSGACSNEPA